MKIGIYSPYLPKQMGGGEKYIFDVARCCAELGHQVSILLTETVQSDVKEKYENFLGVSLADVLFVKSAIGSSASFFEKLMATKSFDVLYLVTDGSLFFSLAQKNILHIQIPFTNSKSGIIERAKLANWPIRNTNSLFTKQVIEKNWQINIPFVHYPMIELPQAKYAASKKEKIILNVGRFFDHLHSKRQDIIVEGFKELITQFPKESNGWKLILIGPAEDKIFAAKIATMSEGLPIEIHHTASRKELDRLYEKATFYWHAAGFEVDEEKSPEKVEHFGISTVEAMNYGCIPIPVGKGGQVEVLGDGLKNLSWQNVKELVAITSTLMTDKLQQEAYAKAAVSQSKNFNKEKFVSTLKEMLQ